jgi:hypothetical protein
MGPDSVGGRGAVGRGAVPPGRREASRSSEISIQSDCPCADVGATAAMLGRTAARVYQDEQEDGAVEERKAMVRALPQEIRLKKVTRQAVLRWYRLPRD